MLRIFPRSGSDSLQSIQEFVSGVDARIAPESRIDREKGIIHGVKILGLESKNGRRYPPATLTKAAPLYEGAKVNVDHPDGHADQPRSYAERIGVIRSPVVREDGLFGDFHFNPKHALAEQLLWDAEHAPENVGFSHNVQARTKQDGSVQVVEQITNVVSVDLVADPATTNSLYESEIPMSTDGAPAPATPDPAAPAADPGQASKQAFRDLVIAAFDDESLDAKATLAKIKDILSAQEKLLGGGPAAPEDPAAPAEPPVPESHAPQGNVLESLTAIAKQNAESIGKLTETVTNMQASNGVIQPRSGSAGPLTEDFTPPADAKSFADALTSDD